MKKEDIGFWLLIIGILILLYKKGQEVWTTKSIGSDSMSMFETAGIVAAATGTVLLWNKVQ